MEKTKKTQGGAITTGSGDMVSYHMLAKAFSRHNFFWQSSQLQIYSEGTWCPFSGLYYNYTGLDY